MIISRNSMKEEILYYLAPMLLIFALLAQASAAQSGPQIPATLIVGSASLLAPAVINNNTGTLTNISVTVTKGTGYVEILGPRSIGGDTNASALNASMSAAQYLGLNYRNYNFIYTIADYNQSVSGPSAGTAMALLSISAISGKSMTHNFTVTGTIYNGTVGPVGGVYDKTSAAASRHIRFIIVPKVAQGSEENELYYFIQSRFGIPVMQVANISAAAGYAFGTSPIANSSTTFTFYNNYHTGLIPKASLSCSNSCNATPFEGLTGFTFNLTASEISKVSGFPNVSAHLYSELNQSEAIASLGYLYTGSDISFLNYINAFYFSNNNPTITGGMQTLQNISNHCASLSAPALTQQNYEWVVSGELRQAWGSYTAASASSIYGNVSALTTDDVLASLYQGGQASGWCQAANYMFSIAKNIGGTPASVSQNLSSVAKSRISRAATYGDNLYLTTAETAYSNNNYPLAIMGADYAYAGGLAGATEQNMSTAQLLNASVAIAANSTYGTWATQFSNEAMFYVHQSGITNSLVGAHSNALQAYSAALLARQVSNDTMLIYRSISPGKATTTVTQIVQKPQYNVQQIVLLFILAIMVMILVVDFVILFMVSRMMHRRYRTGTRRRRRR